MTRRVVLVTGGSGKLGQAVCAFLSTVGWHVRALVHRQEVPVADERVEGSLGDASSLRRALDGAHAVLHLAAVTHARRVSDYESVNLAGTRSLLLAGAEAGGAGRFVFVSTRAVSPEGGAYSRSKLLAEEAVRTSGRPFVIVRLPEIYGLGGDEGIDRIIEHARAGRLLALPAADRAVVCPVYSADIVPAIAVALDSQAALGKTYTLAGECLSLREFAKLCEQRFESTAPIVSVPELVVRAAAAVSRFLPLPVYPDQLSRLLAAKPEPSAEAKSDLGFQPRPPGEGLMALV